MQEGCDYLIARTSEGKLDLRDIFVQDKELGISSRPAVLGSVPEQPLYFQEWPWVVEFTGDRVNGKRPWKRVSACPATSRPPDTWNGWEVKSFIDSAPPMRLFVTQAEEALTAEGWAKNCLFCFYSAASMPDVINLLAQSACTV